jgi:hypothetical protein
MFYISFAKPMPKTAKNGDCFLKRVKAYCSYIFLMFRKVIFGPEKDFLSEPLKMAYF